MQSTLIIMLHSYSVAQFVHLAIKFVSLAIEFVTLARKFVMTE